MVFTMKCPACGLMQMAGPTCKSCGRPLGGPAPRPGPPQIQPRTEVAATSGQGPTKKSKKFLVVLGAGLLVLVAWGIIGFGVLKLWSYGSQLGAGSKAYVDEVVPQIVSSWNSRELMDRASPELIATASPEKIDKVFRAFSDRLGPLKTYEGSRGQARVSVTPQTGKVSVASYVAEATFEKAKASIHVNLIMQDGKWQIMGFHVNSDALIP